MAAFATMESSRLEVPPRLLTTNTTFMPVKTMSQIHHGYMPCSTPSGLYNVFHFIPWRQFGKESSDVLT